MRKQIILINVDRNYSVETSEAWKIKSIPSSHFQRYSGEVLLMNLPRSILLFTHSKQSDRSLNAMKFEFKKKWLMLGSHQWS